MDVLLLGIITVMAWGTWLAPSEKVRLPNAQARGFHVALANFVIAAAAFVIHGPGQLGGIQFVFPFVGGVIWSIAGWMAFSATARLGMARAMGTWSPLNIVVGIAWGMILFGEFLRSGPWTLPLGLVSIATIIAGILLIIFAESREQGSEALPARATGFAGAVGAGFLWGSYFVPTAWLARRLEGVSDWDAAFPLACGMLAGSLLLVVLSGKMPRCERSGDYVRVLASGCLWSVGNFSMLMLVARIGIGAGFTIAQMCVVVNALIGIVVFREPPPRTRAARRTLIGVTLATIGAIVLGNLKSGM